MATLDEIRASGGQLHMHQGPACVLTFVYCTRILGTVVGFLIIGAGIAGVLP